MSFRPLRSCRQNHMQTSKTPVLATPKRRSCNKKLVVKQILPLNKSHNLWLKIWTRKSIVHGTKSFWQRLLYARLTNSTEFTNSNHQVVDFEFDFSTIDLKVTYLNNWQNLMIKDFGKLWNPNPVSCIVLTGAPSLCFQHDIYGVLKRQFASFLWISRDRLLNFISNGSFNCHEILIALQQFEISFFQKESQI